MMGAMSLLVVMGSGETAPTMVKAHRAILARSGVPQAGPAVMLDTTFGFQMNADDLVAKTQAYFDDSVGASVLLASWRRRDSDPLEQEKTLALIAQARWAFAGPGSPTYALGQWRDTAVPQALADVVLRGGTLVFGSAAACTVGTHTVPVYEIYKAGIPPYWECGLDLLGALTGIHAVVVPHFDNAEGGVYDTRFCYLGEPRLAALETLLPDDVGVLGVDEHTAIVIDRDARVATVSGNGTVTVRRREGRRRVLPSGTEIGLDELGALVRGEGWDGADRAGAPGTARGTQEAADAEGGDDTSASAVEVDAGALPAEPQPTSLAEHTEAARRAFEAALAARDVDGCVAAVLGLEAAIVAWSTDTLQGDDTDRARRLLRSLVVRLGELAVAGVRDPADAVRPFVDLLLELRGRARAAKDYATGDLVRDRLVTAGIEVRDTPDGVSWSMAGSAPPSSDSGPAPAAGG